MSPNGRTREGRELPSFRGTAEAVPGEEEQGAPTALAMAISEAAKQAASYLHANGMSETSFEVSRIQITVAPNPGPTSYSATITLP